MNQTFYIDVDEEISSVVDRVRRSVSQQNFLVVPKRAIFLQSIVNLKLLKREAEKIGKSVVIVTQDEMGISMAKKCGLLTQETVEHGEIARETTQTEDFSEEEEVIGEEVMPEVKPKGSKKNRLSVLGSEDFYGKREISETQEKPLPSEKKKVSSGHVKRVAVNGISGKSQASKEEIRHEIIKPRAKSDGIRVNYDIKRRPREGAPLHAEDSYQKKLEPNREKAVEKMFGAPKALNFPRESLGKETGHASKKVRNFFVGFFLVCALVLGGVGTYLIVPSAKIIITPNVQKKKMDVGISVGNEAGNKSEFFVPVRVIEKEIELTTQNKATGRSPLSGQKAKGSVVIYNEYSAEPQTLVATTRIEAESGKIFRLEKNVVVPGTMNVGGEVKPGAITVEVIADEPGSDYNLEPAKFTIPGFKGGPKFEKFYAKSTTSISGGSSNGDTSLAVSQADIDAAKTKTDAELAVKIKSDLAEQLQPGEILLEQATRVIKTASNSSARVGDLTQEFGYTANAAVKALVFSENDVKTIIGNQLGKEDISNSAGVEITKMEYGGIEVDFETNSIELKVYAEIALTPTISEEELKKELLGKSEEQYNKIFNKYPAIKGAKIEFSPSFVTRIPPYTKRVSIELRNPDL